MNGDPRTCTPSSKVEALPAFSELTNESTCFPRAAATHAGPALLRPSPGPRHESEKTPHDHRLPLALRLPCTLARVFLVDDVTALLVSSQHRLLAGDRNPGVRTWLYFLPLRYGRSVPTMSSTARCSRRESTRLGTLSLSECGCSDVLHVLGRVSTILNAESMTRNLSSSLSHFEK